MKNLMAATLLTVFSCGALLVPAGTASAEPAASPATADAALARTIAERYGLAAWDGVGELAYTFNVSSPKREVARGWTWDVAGNTVTRRDPDASDGAVTIDLTADPAGWTKVEKQVHQQFINDSYWLLFPFQLVWSDPAVTDAGPASLPEAAGSGNARKVVTQWPAEGGYTPGDAYDLFLDDDGIIRAWTFRRGGGETGRSMTFAGYAQVGPLLLSLDHRGADDFRLFFTDVQLTLRSGEHASAAGPR